jgi:DNA transformation protein
MSLPESALDDAEEALVWARLSLPPARAAAEAKRRQKARKAASRR